jgi:hypothetical protein
MPPERVARALVDVVERGIGPEVSLPRWVASFQLVRLMAPPLYRWGFRRAAERGLGTTRAGGG